MNLKYYRKRIAIVVVLFTFIPVLLFAGVFYRQIYNDRIDYHLAINEKYMNAKVEILQDEIIQKSKIVKNISQNLNALSNQSGKSNDDVLSDFLRRNNDFSNISILSDVALAELVENKFETRSVKTEIDIQYYIKDSFQLFITYPFENDEEGLEYVLAEFPIDGIVKWFTEFAPDTYIVVVSEDEMIYKSQELEGLDFDKLNHITNEISILEVADERHYFSLKNDVSDYNMSFYILKKDSTIDVFRSLYMDYIMKIMFMIILSAAVTFVISLKLNYPFNKVKNAARAIINGDYDAKVDNVDDELLSLNLSFNEMALLHQEKNEEFVQYAMTMLEKK